MASVNNRLKAALARLGPVPLAFLGVGLYRAWLATFFRFDAFPTMGFVDYALFESAIGVTSLAAAFLARRVSPLWSNRVAVRLTVGTMTAGSCLCVVACFLVPSTVLKGCGLVAAGVGLGLLILMWAEFYGSLNPMRVAVYHAAGIFFGEAVKWLFTGLEASYIAVFSIGLPLVAVHWARRAMLHLPERDLPRKMRAGERAIVPWKPIALMAVCTFASGYGLLPDQPLLAGNLVGAMFVTALVFCGTLSASKWFNFDVIYRLAFPLMTVGLLLVAPSLSPNPQIAAACYDAGYTMLSMFVMIVLSNITYHFNINAVWLNGIERGIRYLVEAMGWALYAVASSTLTAQAHGALHWGITALVVVAFAIIFLTEQRLSAKWGINLRPSEQDPFSPGQLALRVSDLSRTHNLSPREEEVLQLIARKESVAQIEQDLFVARGTVKAHTSRIYRKMGVHSKAELFELLGIEDEDEPLAPQGS